MALIHFVLLVTWYIQCYKKGPCAKKSPIQKFAGPENIFSLNVKTNIGAAFLKLVDKHFNKDHPLHKYFNRSKIKVSYCTMPIMKQHINKHNAKILRGKQDTIETRSCNFRSSQLCPVNGQCLQKSLVYQADVKCQNTVKTYYGLTELTFKERYNKHTFSFRDLEQQHSTSLSTYLAKCKQIFLGPLKPEHTQCPQAGKYVICVFLKKLQS